MSARSCATSTGTPDLPPALDGRPLDDEVAAIDRRRLRTVSTMRSVGVDLRSAVAIVLGDRDRPGLRNADPGDATALRRR